MAYGRARSLHHSQQARYSPRAACHFPHDHVRLQRQRTPSSQLNQHTSHNLQPHSQANMTSEPVEFRDARAVRALMNSYRIDFKRAAIAHAFAEPDHRSPKPASEPSPVREPIPIAEQVDGELNKVAERRGSTASRKRKAASLVSILRQHDIMHVFQRHCSLKRPRVRTKPIPGRTILPTCWAHWIISV